MNVDFTYQQLSDLLDQKLDEKLAPIYAELKEHSKVLQKHDKDLRYLKRSQKLILDVLDREQMNQRKRLIRIEEHLGFSPSTM